MLYMSSQSTTDGQMTLTITFKLGTDLDKAQVLVQNRVAIAEPRLPEDVARHGGASLARGRSPRRRHHRQELARPAAGGAPDVAGPDARSAVHRQLRAH